MALLQIFEYFIYIKIAELKVLKLLVIEYLNIKKQKK